MKDSARRIYKYGPIPFSIDGSCVIPHCPNTSRVVAVRIVNDGFTVRRVMAWVEHDLEEIVGSGYTLCVVLTGEHYTGEQVGTVFFHDLVYHVVKQRVEHELRETDNSLLLRDTSNPGNHIGHLDASRQ